MASSRVIAIIVIIIIVVILMTTTATIIRHKLGLNRPVSKLSNSLFKGLLIHLRPFGL